MLARKDDRQRREKVAAARQIIYDQQYVVDTPQVERLLKGESLVPTEVRDGRFQGGERLLIYPLECVFSET